MPLGEIDPQKTSFMAPSAYGIIRRHYSKEANRQDQENKAGETTGYHTARCYRGERTGKDKPEGTPPPVGMDR